MYNRLKNKILTVSFLTDCPHIYDVHNYADCLHNYGVNNSIVSPHDSDVNNNADFHHNYGVNEDARKEKRI